MATVYSMLGNVVIGETIQFKGAKYKVEQVELKPRGKEHEAAVGLSRNGKLFMTRRHGDYILVIEA